jgi:ABC-type branched-subunit amino acid transport system substrate-binding protein
MARRELLALLGLAVVALAACGGGDRSAGAPVVIVVNAPFSVSETIGTQIARGVELAAAEANRAGGLGVGGTTREVRVVRLDSGLSPARAVANVRDGVARGAIAVIDEGTGVEASSPIAAAAGMPIGIAYQGAAGPVDVHAHPNVFRIAPTDRGIAFRLAEYLIPKGQHLALLHDDTDYGDAGAAALDRAFARNPEAVVARLAIPARGDAAAAMLRARRAGATGVIVWARAPAIAAAISASHQAGWGVPIATPPTGLDPLVRQELAGEPGALDAVTVASGRLTAEQGPAPFTAFQRAYEAAGGPDLVGVRTSDGHAVAVPPETAMYAYDLTRLVLAAVARSGHTSGPSLLAALEAVDVAGANGDTRGFNRASHEGVVDDDVVFARFDGLVVRPVTDDGLSSTLPYVEQRR